MASRASWQSLVLSAVTAACSSSNTSLPRTDHTSAALSADVNAYVTALCDRTVACSEATPFFSSKEGCVERFLAHYGCDARLAAASLEDLGACLEALAQTPCGNILAQPLEPASCLTTQASLEHSLGYSLAEEVCGDETRCVAGAICHHGEDCGICKPEQAAGDECESECQGDLFCNDAGTCEPLRVKGEDCASDLECYSRVCSSEGKCSTDLELGGPCIEGIYCGDGLRCVDNECVLLGKIGDACNEVDDDIPACTYDAACVDGRCQALARCGEGKRGAPCSSDAQCAQGFGCSPIQGRCLELAKEGQDCSADDIHCAAGLHCELSDGADYGVCRAGEPAERPEEQLCSSLP